MSNEDEKTPVAPENEPVKTPDPETSEGGRRRTPWMAHVKATMKSHKGMKLKQVLKLAKKTYKKSFKRGGAVLTPLPLTGGRKTRRRATGRKH